MEANGKSLKVSQGLVIDIMTYNPYSLQYYSFWKGKIGFGRTVPVSWTTPIHTRRYSLTVDSFGKWIFFGGLLRKMFWSSEDRVRARFHYAES